jgi:hypothetical protein
MKCQRSLHARLKQNSSCKEKVEGRMLTRCRKKIKWARKIKTKTRMVKAIISSNNNNKAKEIIAMHKTLMQMKSASLHSSLATQRRRKLVHRCSSPCSRRRMHCLPHLWVQKRATEAKRDKIWVIPKSVLRHPNYALAVISRKKYARQQQQ